MATRPEKHHGGTRVHPPPPSEADQAAFADSAGDAVQVVSISKSYGRHRHRVEALQDVTTSFAHDTLTAVMGLSGCGKSTLLQCAAGLDRPTAGSVRIGETNITKLSRKKLSVLRRERVGFVFQSLNLVPTLSVAENIALPLRLDGRHVDHSACAKSQPWSASPTSCGECRTRCLAASDNAWRSRERLSQIPRSSSPTSRLRRSTRTSQTQSLASCVAPSTSFTRRLSS